MESNDAVILNEESQIESSADIHLTISFFKSISDSFSFFKYGNYTTLLLKTHFVVVEKLTI
jgi:hypothetical protein